LLVVSYELATASKLALQKAQPAAALQTASWHAKLSPTHYTTNKPQSFSRQEGREALLCLLTTNH
jgi:hypothetical protein